MEISMLAGGGLRHRSGSHTDARQRGEEMSCVHDLLTRACRAKAKERNRLREAAVLAGVPLARRLARQYAGRGVDLDDLEQVAMLGLCKAVRGYDAARHTGFAAYAIPTITGELRRHFRDCAWLVRPTRSLQELARAAREASPVLAQELQRQPTEGDLAAQLGVQGAQVRRAMAAERACWGSSLDLVPNGSTASIGDGIPEESDDLEAVETAAVLGPLVQRLGVRERRILDMRFRDGLTQQEIGALIGVSQMQVSRLLSATLKSLRQGLEDGLAEEKTPPTRAA